MSELESKLIRLLIVDDHKVVRLGLHTLLSRHAGIEVVGEAGTAAAAVEEAARLHPDVVLMDVRLPDGSGFEACRQLRKSQLETRVLFLTSFADEEIVLESIDAGGDGRWDHYTAVQHSDGSVDIYEDRNHDGRVDFIGHDRNHDGRVESASFFCSGSSSAFRSSAEPAGHRRAGRRSARGRA